MGLEKYNQKRNFRKTKEPIGEKEKGKKKLRYVIQHHMARREHYDLRLEWNGVLISFAVPKGPSFNPKDKRLAIKVEDHPIAYRNFEGTIPKGEYGGGTVMLFDQGYYEPIGDFQKGLKKGNLKFVIRGKRIKGAFTLVRFKENNWLLIKENDKYINSDDINNYKTSIKTGRTMEEISLNKEKKKFKTSRKDAIICGIKITNPDKIIFKNPKITKLDIALYYHKVAKKMLPLIKNRIISTIRMPDGYGGEKFFKKHLGENPYLGKVTIPNNSLKKEDYYYIKDEQGLIYEVQMNSFEFHIWGSLVSDINHPDMMVFDLDPEESLSLDKIQDGVKDLKKILNELNLKASIKTSGGKGYHIIVFLKQKVTWKKFRNIAKMIAEALEERYPDKYTTNIRKKERKGKIFIDWIRNTKSATSVAPYSLRLKNKPTLSVPIAWNKIDEIGPQDFTIDDYLKD